MHALMVLVAASAFGVDVGWEPLPDGGLEYIIQIEPQLLDTLLKGHDLVSELPAGLNVKRYRITVGDAKLPRENEPAANQPAANLPTTGPPLSANEPGGLDPRRGLGPETRVLPEEPAAAAVESPRAALGARTFGDESRSPTPVAEEGAFQPPALSQNQPSQPHFPSEPAGGDPFAVGPAARPDAMGHSGAATPRHLQPEPAAPLEGSQTNFTEPHNSQAPRSAAKIESHLPGHSATIGHTPAHTASTTADAESKPWWVWTCTLLALFASLGSNVYLGWLAASARTRCRDLIDKFRGMPLTA
jgi:hypothetical protein